MLWHRLITLVRKELQALLRDPSGRELLIAPVLFQILLFPFAASLEVNNISVAILNQDSGGASTEIVERLAASPSFADLRFVTREKDLRDAIDRQVSMIGVRFQPNFSRDLTAGQSSLQVIGDGRRANSAQIATGYIQSIVQQYQADLPRSASIASPDVRVVVRNWYNPNLESQWFILPSLVAIITTVGCLIVTALSVAREREQGTLDQTLVSPLGHGMILIGKAIPAMMVATVQATIILLVAMLIFAVPFTGSLALLYVSILVYGLALAGFGLLISSLSATQQQAFLGVFSFLLPAVLLSGFIAPVENMPVWLQWVSWIDPLRHFIVIVKGLFLKGYGLTEVFAHLWPLVMIAVATMSGAYVIFRKGTA
ncbi:ABC transporter permease [Novosphingopyxis sp.]|uniref:ABC transporter permease n=1 Tax=Novosphingopyxis sp. TaxID=2709690 RepID=UPI003B5AB5A9